MTYYLYEGEIRNDEYAAESVLGVLERVAALYRPDSAELQFAGDLIIYTESSWQELLNDYRDEEDEPDALESFLRMTGAPEHIPDTQLLLFVSAFPLGGPSEPERKEVYRVISPSPSASEIEGIFDAVLPDFAYRIREDSH